MGADAGRIRQWAVYGVAAAVLLTAGWWAGRVTLKSPVSGRSEPIHASVVTVKEAKAGRSLSLNVTVTQTYAVVAVNALPGTITSVDAIGTARVGTVLYTVDETPVRAVVGDMPFYRDLGTGVKGADVSQLQRALRALGHYDGNITGLYDWGTSQAVRAWQRALKTTETGTVRLGEVVAVPKLPASLRLGEAIIKGARVGGAEPAVLAPTGKIGFALVVSETQAALIPDGATVTVTHGTRHWSATVGEAQKGDPGAVTLGLTAPGGGVVCGKDCAELPAQERTTLPAKVIVVPEVVGPAVPVAAVHTQPDGTAYVLLEGGARRDVTVRGSSGGIAIVDNLQVGDRVLVGDGAGS